MEFFLSMTEYARSTAVYREIRAALDPWCRQSGYRRSRGSEPGWVRALDKEQNLSFSLRCNRWGGGALGGNEFFGLVQTEGSGAPPGSVIVRQSDFSLCLLQPELDELRRIQNAINRRRPRTAELEQWMREDSPVGEHAREMYKQYESGEKPYRVGDFATFGYYSIGDVRVHLGFLLQRLPDIITRFLENRVARPNPVPQPAFLARRP